VLAALPDDVLDRLLVGARPVEAPAGTVLYREGDAPRCGVLLSGPGARLHRRPRRAPGHDAVHAAGRPLGLVAGRDGRAGRRARPAVTAIRGLLLDVAGLRALAQSDARVGWALAREVARSQGGPAGHARPSWA